MIVLDEIPVVSHSVNDNSRYSGYDRANVLSKITNSIHTYVRHSALSPKWVVYQPNEPMCIQCSNYFSTFSL